MIRNPVTNQRERDSFAFGAFLTANHDFWALLTAGDRHVPIFRISGRVVSGEQETYPRGSCRWSSAREGRDVDGVCAFLIHYAGVERS
jgi:hypothetical protein